MSLLYIVVDLTMYIKNLEEKRQYNLFIANDSEVIV